MSIDDDWKNNDPTESVDVMMSTRDLAVLCNAAVLNGQTLQDFVFLAAWDAANGVLTTAQDDEAACGGYNSYGLEG